MVPPGIYPRVSAREREMEWVGQAGNSLAEDLGRASAVRPSAAYRGTGRSAPSGCRHDAQSELEPHDEPELQLEPHEDAELQLDALAHDDELSPADA